MSQTMSRMFKYTRFLRTEKNFRVNYCTLTPGIPYHGGVFYDRRLQRGEMGLPTTAHLGATSKNSKLAMCIGIGRERPLLKQMIICFA